MSKPRLSVNTAVTVMTVLAITITAAMTACAPPKPGDDTAIPGGGHAIIKASPSARSPFKTVEIDGTEMIEARGEVGQFGGTFYETQLGEGPKTFNGWQSSDATSSAMAAMMHVGLVDTDAYTGEVTPYLAKEIKLLDDQKTYRVTLRKGLKWSDGKPLTSKDVVFTWNEIIAKGLGNASSRDVNTINGKFPVVRAVDALTIEFITAEPFAPFMRNLAQAIAPAHILAPIAKQGNNVFSSFWGASDAEKRPEKFVTSGMWLLESYNPTEKRVVFKPNPHFFMVDKKKQRLPYLEKYVVSFVSDLNNLHLQFEQGKTDIYSVAGDKLALTRKLTKPDFNLYNLGPNTGTTFLTFNLNTRKSKTGKPLVDPVKSSWFTKTEFRQAVDYAINRQDIVANVLKGVGEPLFTAESLPSIFLNQTIAKGHPQDIEKAKTLLKQAGFKLNAKQQLVDANGNLVEFTLYTNAGNNIREAIGVQLKEDLAQLGMKVNFKPIEFNVLTTKIDDSSWDAMVMGLTGGTLEPNMGANVWKSDGSLHMFNQRVIPEHGPVDLSDRFPWEIEIDQVFADGVKVFGLEERKKIYDRYQAIAYEQQPFVYLYSGLNMVAMRSRIQNFDPTPLATLHNLEEIWIKE